MNEKSQISYVIYLNHVHIFKSVIFQEVLHILYFKIIQTISQKFDSNFRGPKLAQTLYCPFNQIIDMQIPSINFNNKIYNTSHLTYFN